VYYYYYHHHHHCRRRRRRHHHQHNLDQNFSTPQFCAVKGKIRPKLWNIAICQYHLFSHDHESFEDFRKYLKLHTMDEGKHHLD